MLLKSQNNDHHSVMFGREGLVLSVEPQYFIYSFEGVAMVMQFFEVFYFASKTCPFLFLKLIAWR